MPKAKIAITIERRVLDRLDSFVRASEFRNRSQAIEASVEDKLRRVARTRLLAECAKLDPASERRIADEGLAGDLPEWPQY